MLQEYTYKYRIYPNDEPIVLFNKTFGCCRLVYNYYLKDFLDNSYISKYEKNNHCNNI